MVYQACGSEQDLERQQVVGLRPVSFGRLGRDGQRANKRTSERARGQKEGIVSNSTSLCAECLCRERRREENEIDGMLIQQEQHPKEDEDAEGRLLPLEAPRASSGLRRVDSKSLKVLKRELQARKGKSFSAQGVILLLLSKIAATGHIVTTRLLLHQSFFKPSALAVFRNATTLVFLGSILGIKPDLRSNLKGIKREVITHWPQVVLGAALTFVLQTFVMQSLRVIPAVNLAVLSQLSPPFLFLISGYILKTEAPTLQKFLGMIAAVTGAVIIIDPTNFKAGELSAMYGNLMCCGMALAYAVIVTVQKNLVDKVPAAALQFTFTLYAVPFFIALAFAMRAFEDITLTLESLSGALFVGVCASLDYYFAFAALKFVSTLVVGLANSMLPLFVGITAYFVNGEALGVNDLVGGLLLLGGMIRVISAETSERGDKDVEEKEKEKEEEEEEEEEEGEELKLLNQEHSDESAEESEILKQQLQV